MTRILETAQVLEEAAQVNDDGEPFIHLESLSGVELDLNQPIKNATYMATAPVASTQLDTRAA